MTEAQQARALALLRMMAFDDGPKWRDQLGRKPCFLDFWLAWRDRVNELENELEDAVIAGRFTSTESTVKEVT